MIRDDQRRAGCRHVADVAGLDAPPTPVEKREQRSDRIFELGVEAEIVGALGAPNAVEPGHAALVRFPPPQGVVGRRPPSLRPSPRAAGGAPSGAGAGGDPAPPRAGTYRAAARARGLPREHPADPRAPPAPAVEPV